eukprot:Protomagalhaensia_wolfi_Nauph_80__421@NODE_1231_length_1644_cov_318_935826_g882_i1_p2_GENE_NODE_1231_length_1644_cov_318_935826_g882_i1NODE_1231_length_1644_cov_318_935826_g882_i1_p2_ORF_typecomplete_len234_score24_07_NODE_1231_length_1644_cov_318_935826_g882_i17921493
MPYEVFAIPEAQLSSCDTGVLAGYNSSLTDEACRLQCAQGRCDQAMSFIAIGRCLESNWIRPCAFEYHEGIRQRFPFCKQSSLLAIECTQDLVPLYQVDELWLTLNSPKDNLFDCQEHGSFGFVATELEADCPLQDLQAVMTPLAHMSVARNPHHMAFKLTSSITELLPAPVYTLLVELPNCHAEFGDAFLEFTIYRTAQRFDKFLNSSTNSFILSNWIAMLAFLFFILSVKT